MFLFVGGRTIKRLTRTLFALTLTFTLMSACLPKTAGAEVIYDENGVAAYLLLPDRIMEVFHKNDWWQSRYAEAINKLREATSENTRVFSIIAPTQIEFTEKPEIVSDSQNQSIAHINSILSEDVIKVDAYNAISGHLDEFVYFRTDNHWTALGAYYAYEEFCAEAGFEAIPLTDYNEHKAEGMKGLFWDQIPSSLNIQPDTMYYYTLKDGGFTTTRPLVNEKGWYYGMFIDGGYVDYYDIETSVKNNRTAIVVKDSFAHCFVPFIAPHYERIIVLDPRFLKDRPEGFSMAVESKKYDNVDFIFLNYTLAATFYDFITWMESCV